MDQIRVRCAVIRGGTSKGVYILANELPSDPKKRDRVILRIFGSPDVRQIDGLGGADPLTSKVAIISRSERPDADVDYTFGQVSLTDAFVDYSGNCGNISSGVGPFAIDEGLVKAVEPVTRVRIHNTNTGKILIAEVPVKDGKARVIGDCRIDGVPGTAAEIKMDFADTAGAVTGKLLPTGNPRDILDVEGVGPIEVSLVDAANPMVFVRARDLGLRGTESPAEVNNNKDLLNKLEAIRSAACFRMGMVKSASEATKKSPAFPMLAFVTQPVDYRDFTTGRLIPADSVDIVSRCMFMQVMHKTYAGTGTCCTGAAALIPGTVVNEVLRESAKTADVVRIGHPAGVISVEARVEMGPSGPILKRAIFSRTSRRIMDGYVYIPKDSVEE
ncbi:MAG TPA: 3-methylitaconate isomerase [Firmicutes bacterium]|nr:3-methylitaconate isomerase [Bacillota bacterium]